MITCTNVVSNTKNKKKIGTMDQLPEDILFNIFKNADIKTQLQLRQTARLFYHLVIIHPVEVIVKSIEQIKQLPKCFRNVHLTFYWDFNQPLKPGDIPNSVTHLTFGRMFNQPLKPGVIPNSVTHLTFDYWFDKPLQPGDIPNSVTHLVLGYWFDYSLEPNVIPNSVTHLRFSYRFHQKLKYGVMPNSLQVLEIFSHQLRFIDDPWKNAVKLLDSD